MTKKVIIIGGGVSGLSCGIYCQKLGLQSIILEKTKNLGGNLTGWKRENCYIDNCVHWLNGSKNESPYNKLWREVGAIDDSTLFNQSEYFYLSETDGKQVGISQNLEETQHSMLCAAPEDAKNIKKFISALKLFICLSKKKRLGKIFPAIKLFRLYGRKTVGEVAKQFKSKIMKNFLTDYILPEYSIYVLLAASASFVTGDGKVPIQGSLKMAEKIAKKYLSLGGETKLGQEVVKVNKINNKIISVATDKNEIISGDYFVFACDPQIVFPKFIEKMPKNLENTYKNRKNYPIISAFHIAYDVKIKHLNIPESLIIDCPPIKIGNSVYTRIMLRNYEYGKNFAPDGHVVLQVFILTREADYDHFASLSSKEYASEKKQISGEIKKVILNRFPELKDIMTQIDCWTPLTYNKFFNAYKGAFMSFGITKSIRLSKVQSKLNASENAFIATQWQSLFGGLPNALMAGKECAEHIVKEIKK